MESTYKVLETVKVRTDTIVDPSTDTRTFLQAGLIIVGFEEKTAGGLIWLHHASGWSAMKSEDGTQTFLVQVEVPTRAFFEGQPDLFTDFPCRPDVRPLFQYFGNTPLAVWFNRDLYAYSQCYHGGIDLFGPLNHKIVAGLSGIVIGKRKQGTPYEVIDVSVGNDYTVHYQHLRINPALNPGDSIAPDTDMGKLLLYLEPGNEHLHLEIRYKMDWIVNPLLLMPEHMRQAIIGCFDPAKPHFNNQRSALQYFYKLGQWDQWTSHDDQPVIQRYGPPLGPIDPSLGKDPDRSLSDFSDLNAWY